MTYIPAVNTDDRTGETIEHPKIKRNFITYGQLLQWHNELNQFKSSVVYYLLKGRVNDFYKEYSLRINTTVDEITFLNKKYFQYDENDKPVIQTTDGKNSWVLKEGLTKEDYKKEMDLILNREVL